MREAGKGYLNFLFPEFSPRISLADRRDAEPRMVIGSSYDTNSYVV